MFTWAKKLTRHHGREEQAGEGNADNPENSKSELKQRPDKSPGRRSSTEEEPSSGKTKASPKQNPEKKTPSFARRLASFRKIALDRGNPEKSPKLKNKISGTSEPVKNKSSEKKQEADVAVGSDAADRKSIPEKTNSSSGLSTQSSENRAPATMSQTRDRKSVV